MGRTQQIRRRGWMLVPVLALAGLPGVAQGSIPENLHPTELWAARYNGPGNSSDYAHSLAVAPDGSKVFVTGSSVGSGGYPDYATSAYDSSSGAELWTARYNGPGSFFDVAYSLAVSPDGSKVFVTGGSVGSGGSTDYATVAYASASGAELWTARYNGSGRSFDVAVSPDGSKVFVTGDAYATVAYASANGAQLWAARYNGEGPARSLSVSPDGSKVFVTGGSWDYATLAYDSTSGTQLWVARYNGLLNGLLVGNSTDIATSLAVSPDGSKVFVTGYSCIPSCSASTNSDYATVAYASAIGAQLWVARYDGPTLRVTSPAGDIHDDAYSLAVSPDGSKVFVTGRTSEWVSSNYATLAYDSTSGVQLWEAIYDGGPGYIDIAYSLAVSSDGHMVFVTGRSGGAYATIAYASANGARRWVARYKGPGDYIDAGYSLAVSPDGSKVFVTGWSAGSSLDYATVAYTATCASGMNEAGPVSGPVHGAVEPASDIAAPYVHGVNCDVVAANGL